MAEGAGLENRYTGNGIVGSNPTLSVMMFAILQVVGPNDCILSGLCGLTPPAWGPPSGVMFTAIGLVALGVIGLRSLRRNS